MLSIDEAIAHAREVAKRNREQWKNCPADRRDIEHQTCEQCAEEHEQLAEWLEELKCYKNDNDFSDYADRLHKIAFNSGYNKALDDFVNTVKATFPHDNIAICNTEVIAEQLKAGIENEQSKQNT